ncbi:hypothetical protein EJB05_35111 [Eragrostis curvula]|uniref:F-box domain-containing protein n=1 Tax=Eragrostis curvula TaxID=38414 RepID=A0A5J9U6X0_9POAL|nr:hypothetical protein EJB05_35111 [Eragrostis curvula]
MAPSLRSLVTSCFFRSTPARAPAPAPKDHDIIPADQIGSVLAPAPAPEDHDVILETGSAPAPDLEDDDILREILIRLPRLPSSLIRASLVCKRWCRVISDPFFLRRYRTHHRTHYQKMKFS